MGKPFTFAVLAVLVLAGLLVFFNGVSAQSTPANVAPEYKDLIVNIPIVEQITKDGIPIVRANVDIRKGLDIVAQGTAEKPVALYLLSENNNIHALHILLSDGEGEIQVYRIRPEYGAAFELMDCSAAPLDTETGNVYDGVMSRFGPISAQTFLQYYNCDRDWISDTYMYDFVNLEGAYIPFNTSLQSLGADSENVSKVKQAFSDNAQAFLVPQTSPNSKQIPKEDNVDITLSPPTCKIENSVGKIELQKGKSVSGNFTTIAPNTGKTSTIIFYEKVGTVEKQLYALQIQKLQANGDKVTMQTQLCVNTPNGWTRGWENISYSILKSNKYEVKLGDESVDSLFTTESDFGTSKPEIVASYQSVLRNSVDVMFSMGTNNSIEELTMNAAADATGSTYRFRLDEATIKKLRDKVPALLNLSNNGIMEELTQMSNNAITLSGTDILFGVDTQATLQTPEGPLFFNANSPKYWKAEGITVPGKYIIKIPITQYKTIEKEVTITPKDLSPANADGLAWGKIQLLSITEDEIKVNFCDLCQSWQACIACIDGEIVSRYRTEP